MSDFQLEQICERGTCNCNCQACAAFWANYRYNNGIEEPEIDE